MKVGLRREDSLCHSKYIVGVNRIVSRWRLFWPPSLVEMPPDLQHCLLSQSRNYCQSRRLHRLLPIRFIAGLLCSLLD